ncbi:MAG: hypothetical protein D6772_10340 [Bacteroidetes bacterium]|nr:MAG: hypothetical protein D6772_10340 [Bacteroidota bacterium]
MLEAELQQTRHVLKTTLKQKWYCLTLKVQARNESVMVSSHDLPAVIASLGVGTCPKHQSHACPDRSVRAYADHACQSTLYGGQRTKGLG